MDSVDQLLWCGKNPAVPHCNGLRLGWFLGPIHYNPGSGRYWSSVYGVDNTMCPRCQGVPTGFASLGFASLKRKVRVLNKARLTVNA